VRPGTSDINVLNTLCGDVIDIFSSSSYELSLFSSKAGSAHSAGGGVPSVSIDDHWPEGSIAGGPAAAATHDRLEASSSRRLPNQNKETEDG
jgi:hypothetical protein